MNWYQEYNLKNELLLVYMQLERKNRHVKYCSTAVGHPLWCTVSDSIHEMEMEYEDGIFPLAGKITDI